MDLLCDSTALGWRGMYASLVQESPWSADLPVAAATGIAFCLADACPVIRSVDSFRHEDVLRPQQFSLLPAQSPSRWTIAGSPRILHMYVHESIFGRAAEGHSGTCADASALIPRLCAYDPVIAGVASTVLNLLREGEANSAQLVDHLAYVLAARLLSHHSERGRSSAAVNAPLSGHRWKNLLDHIDGNLADDLTLEAMAGNLGTHPSQLWRAFKLHLGSSPHQYVLSRRLDRAQHLLAHGNESVASVAAQTGFSSQSHLTSVFKQRFRLTPAQYRRAHHMEPEGA